MSFIAWVVLGGAAGWIASIIMGTNKSQGLIANIIVGVVGAWVGGFIFGYFGNAGVTGFNWYSLGVALVGAVVFISILKILRG
jgi:uncharacterized membrane protein YeaQ/YmgE (transglycosylase-associated protein family)